MRFIRLTKEDQVQLEELQRTSSNFVVRRRCLILLLSGRGTPVGQIVRLVGTHRNTVDRLFNKWDSATADDKISALLPVKGQGAKVKLAPVAELLPGLVEKHNCNLKPILHTLEKEHSVKVSKRTLQDFFKGAGL